MSHTWRIVLRSTKDMKAILKAMKKSIRKSSKGDNSSVSIRGLLLLSDEIEIIG